MKRSQHVSVRVSEEQKQALEQLARSRDVTVAHLMRQAVAEMSEVSSRAGGQAIANQTPCTPNREAELEWLAAEGDRLQRFAGQWIALSGAQLVSHGRDYPQVYQRAREAGVSIPFVEWIPEAKPNTAWMGL